MTRYSITEIPEMQVVELQSVDSTNDFLHRARGQYPLRYTLVTAEYQTAGRGATGSWQSATGENLVFSLLVHPRSVAAPSMFVLSEAICLSICEALDRFAPGFRIKWPNDVYYGDHKVVGILIENELKGKWMEDCILGVGVNVNQRTFSPDAPNPSSLALITGGEVDRSAVLDALLQCFRFWYDHVEEGRYAEIHEQYLQRLYRRGEEAIYEDVRGMFRAVLTDVEPTGHLVLSDLRGDIRRYAFKEVKYVL